MKYDFWAFRVYKNNKRQEMWHLTVGEFSTGKGKIIPTSELEYLDQDYKIKRVNQKQEGDKDE